MTEKQYPKLPEPEQATDDWSVGGVIVEYFTGDQMRAYVDADRAMRAARDAEDAARYRYLTLEIGSYCITDAYENSGGVLKAVAADAAIDAARAAKKGETNAIRDDEV